MYLFIHVDFVWKKEKLHFISYANYIKLKNINFW